jgi:hypothetical protein
MSVGLENNIEARELARTRSDLWASSWVAPSQVLGSLVQWAEPSWFVSAWKPCQISQFYRIMVDIG